MKKRQKRAIIQYDAWQQAILWIKFYTANRRQRRNSDKRNKENAKLKYDNKCHRCGDFSYFTKNCRTLKHLVALYQKSLKEIKLVGDKRYEAHFNLVSETIQGEGCSK